MSICSLWTHGRVRSNLHSGLYSQTKTVSTPSVEDKIDPYIDSKIDPSMSLNHWHISDG